jgi:hypothetical protein
VTELMDIIVDLKQGLTRFYCYHFASIIVMSARADRQEKQGSSVKTKCVRSYSD